MAFVRVGDDGSQVALFQAEGDEPLRQPHHVALRVPDPAAAEAALRAAEMTHCLRLWRRSVSSRKKNSGQSNQPPRRIKRAET